MSGNKLVLVFENSSGEEIMFIFAYAKSEPSESHIKALANTIIANNSIFEEPPVKAISARVISTYEDYYDLTD